MAGHRKRARKQCGRKQTHGKKPAGKRAARPLTAAERRRKRYAEDAQFRERLLAASRAYYAAHQSKLQARRRERYREEAEQRRNADPSRKLSRNRKRNARQRRRYADDPGYRERARESRRGEAGRRAWLKRAYGITPEEYDAMFERQGGACAICRRKFKRRLCVDHCPVTHIVRGLLCIPCNTALGSFKDRPDLLRAAAAYLEAAMARAAMGVRVPGAAQHEATSAFTRVFDALWRSGALQTRDRRELRVWNDPGSAVHHSRKSARAAPNPGHER